MMLANGTHKSGNRRGKPRFDRRLGMRINFDADQFTSIKLFAIKNKCSFSESVRLLCEWGLLQAKES